MMNTGGKWIKGYQKRKALWLHDGNPRQPHAILSSGNHSSGYVHSESVLQDAFFMNDAARDLISLLKYNGLDIDTVDCMVGPAMGAITIAHDLSRYCAPCRRIFAEKEQKVTIQRGGVQRTIGIEELMPWDVVVRKESEATLRFKRNMIRPGEKVLLVEDVLTTGSSIHTMMRAVSEMGGVVLPYVAVLVNRSGLKEIHGLKIVALINRPMPMWKPEECELCKKGSEAVRPKEHANWTRLNRTY